ncbi:telomeric repeat-binding factor 2-interacting protein 1 [Pygocentrus nattereri]|uniref:telomeric repeat-binding factor 2-interacting protein 1 n=1 Tax=Pygocentrus nattereri TaxID=42514 RepID=UPI0008149173|nr:telomeric repeat-binding factor 2-interacting protein 1 [Pygocentrus nattereri]XP_017560343.1 telomeric repeat-binding factor 2-interacting protein 1 [Pygocentrus nattereri]XP_017560344.1 telomeric repeat-binding factor 2-interacting protein 1 [Pygocentrus nattereri]
MSAVKGESSATSPVLFLNKNGEPMRFFIRPGPTKTQLQPLIAKGGGVLCRTQESSAILLADPGEIHPVADGASQFYISTQYIHECVLQNQQLDIEQYRFRNLQPVRTRAALRQQRGSRRLGYSLEDDAAILNFISKRRYEAKGNRVWQQMEQEGVTAHTWQSMKDRFLKHLQHKLTDKSPGKKKKVLPLKESSSEDNVSQTSPRKKDAKKTPVTSSCDSDATQISPDVQCVMADTPTRQSDPQSSPEKSSSPQRPSSERNQTLAPSDEFEKEASGDKPDQESSFEQQLCQQDNGQPEVSPKRSRMDQDVTEKETTDGPNDQLTTPTETRQKPSRTHGRKLGILERAAREFEDSQMLDDDSQDDRPLSRTSSVNSETDECQIMAAREKAVREQEAENCNAKQQATQAQNTSGPVDDGPGPSNAAGPVTSNAHMFIFDQESQEDLTHSSQSEPLSQDLLETKQHIVNLMQESKKDLVEVMKALLKASGNVTTARLYLLEGYDPKVHGPIWTKQDDEILLSTDSSELEQLNVKYGEGSVLKRVAFLKAQ